MYRLDHLSSGLEVAEEQMNYMESVSIGIWIRAGARYEDRPDSGISHLLEHVLFKGTEKRDMSAIKQEIEGRGGSFNGFTSEEHTCYLVKVLSKDAELGLDILSDMVLNPRLEEKEMEKEKGVIVEEINMYKDTPAHYVHEILAGMMWPDHPLGRPLAGTVESVRSLTRQKLLAHKNRFYATGNMLVIGVGCIAAGRLAELAGKYLNRAMPRESSAFEKAHIKQGSPLVEVHFKDTEQTHVAIGIHATDRRHPDKYALSVLHVLLGANMSSRLFHIIRDEMGLCYEVSSSVRRYDDCGAFVISAGVDDKKMIRAIEVIMRELARIKKEPVGEDELRRAKEYYKGQMLFALEDTMSHMLWLGEKIVAGEEDLEAGKVLAGLESVTAGDVMRVANDILRDDHLNMAVIGQVKDDKALREALRIR